MMQAHLTRKMLILFLLDYDFVTFHLPVSSNINNTDEVDMCPIQEESTDPKVDLLTIEPSHCAEQLTIMDAVSEKKSSHLALSLCSSGRFYGFHMWKNQGSILVQFYFFKVVIQPANYVKLTFFPII